MIKKPVRFLKLSKMTFPVTAVSSIFHRISGVILFVAIPWLILLLLVSIHSQSAYQAVLNCLSRPLSRFFLSSIIAVVSYHTYAGVRHLLMDAGVGESYSTGTITAWIVIGLTVVTAAIGGIYV